MGGERGAYGNLTFHQFSFSDGHTSPATAAVPPSDSCRCLRATGTPGNFARYDLQNEDRPRGAGITRDMWLANQ